VTQDDLKDLMGRAADASIYYPEYRYKVWGYGEWIAAEGLLSAARICGKARYLGFVEGLARDWISKRDQLVPADHLAPGVALTNLYELTGQEEFLDRAIAVARLILNAPVLREAPGSAGRTWTAVRGWTVFTRTRLYSQASVC
jgi:rhamnogalacturonyl hydrolase YesR